MQQAEPAQRRIVPFAIALATAAAVIVIGLIVWFTIAGWWSIVVDIVLTFTALVSLLMLVLLIAAVYFLTRTILDFKAELMPMLQSLKATSSAVREGAKTASTFGVDPAVRTASVLAGAGEVAAVILGRGHVQKRAEKRQKRRQEIERELASRGEFDGSR